PSVRQNLTARLARGAVVRLAVRVLDALDGRSAHRTRLAELAVRGHGGMKGGDSAGEAGAELLAQATDPLLQGRARDLVEPRHLVVREVARELERRDPREQQDLVGMRVPDSGQDPRVGEGAL